MGRWLLASCGLAGCIASGLIAAEPYEAFLEVLRRERYFDLAQVYLDRLDARPDTPAEFRASIPYQRALLAFEAIGDAPGVAHRLQRIEAARKALAAARSSTTDPSQQVKLNQLMLDALAAKADLLGLQYHAANADDAALRKAASQAYSQAIQAAEVFTKDLKDRLSDMEKKPASEQDTVLRDGWRTMYLAGQIAVPKLRYEAARLYPQDTAEFRAGVQSAVASCKALLEKYSTRRPEVYLELILLSGRCHFAMKDYDQALSFAREVLENKSLPDRYSALATQLAMECLSLQKESQLPSAIAQGEAWLDERPRARSADAAPVRIALARCLLQQAKRGNGRSRAPDYARVRALLVEAARTPGPWRQDTQQLLAEIPVSSESNPMEAKFGSFAEAKLAGDTALGNLQTAEQAMSLVATQAEQPSTADRHAEIDATLAQADENLDTLRQSAMVAYRRALELADDKTPLEDVTQTQFLLAYLMYQQGNYYDAAVLAEFVARERSDASQARSSIRTAMASFAQLLELHPDDPEFAEKHLAQLAEYAVQRWPNDEEGLTATVTLIRLLVSQGRVVDAQEYLDRIPATSPWRADAEITTGVALFRQFQKSTAAPDPSAGMPAASAPLRQAAQELLEAGLAHLKKSDPTPVTVLGALTLAQIHLEANDAVAALKLLEDPQHGPSALLQHDSPAASEYAELILQTELRARLMAPADANPDASPSDLQSLISRLSQQLGDSPAGKERLVGILVRLTSDLRERLPTSGRQSPAPLRRLEPLLAQIVDSTDEGQVLSWAAYTLVEIVDGLDAPDAATQGDRDKLLALAARALRESLDQNSGDDAQRLQDTMRLATVKRRQRDYRAAIPLFAEVLGANPNLLNVQVEAAYTYQEGKAFRYAAKGGRPDPKSGQNRIWGWEKISAVLARQMKRDSRDKEKYNSLFHEARYQLAQCWYRQAVAASGPARADLLKQARRTVETTAALYPDLGGTHWKPQYESLLADIAKAEGKS